MYFGGNGSDGVSSRLENRTARIRLCCLTVSGAHRVELTDKDISLAENDFLSHPRRVDLHEDARSKGGVIQKQSAVFEDKKRLTKFRRVKFGMSIGGRSSALMSMLVFIFLFVVSWWWLSLVKTDLLTLKRE